MSGPPTFLPDVEVLSCRLLDLLQTSKRIGGAVVNMLQLGLLDIELLIHVLRQADNHAVHSIHCGVMEKVFIVLLMCFGRCECHRHLDLLS